MRDIDELLPQILAYAPSCPEPLALRFLRESARQLCHNARLWRDWDTIKISKPTCTGVVTIVDASIIEIQEAQLDGHNLQPVTVAWLDATYPGWSHQDDQENTTASYITQLNPNTVAVHPAQAGTLKIRMVLQPSLEATTLPDNLIDLHATAIGRGAAALALMHPTGDFANPQLGAVLESDYRGKIASIKTEFFKGQQGARLRTKGDWF
jgi:hypothetical protein